MKALKLTLKILFGTLATLVLIVGIAAAVLMYVVFTPERLTPVVREVAKDYISCEHEIGKIDLTFFSTFPEFGLRAQGLLLVNPMEGAASDTVLQADNVIARVDIKKLIDGVLDIHEIALQDVRACAYTNIEGVSNYDVFVLEPDTTEEDTTSDSFIKQVEMHDLRVSFYSADMSYLSEPDSLAASVAKSNIKLEADMPSGSLVKACLKGELNDVHAAYKGTEYAKGLELKVNLPVQVDIDSYHLSIDDKALLSVGDLAICLTGEAEGLHQGLDSITMDLTATTNEWRIEDVLPLVPEGMLPEIMDSIAPLTGAIKGDFHITGMYADSIMPTVDAHLTLQDGDVQYLPLPYEIKPLKAELTAKVDLNDIDHTDVKIESMYAKTKRIELQAKGTLTDVLDKMYLDLAVDVVCPSFDDLDYFLPDSLELEGGVKGKTSIQMYLDDLLDMKLQRGKIRGQFDLGKTLVLAMDTIQLRAQNTTLQFEIPNKRKNTEASRVKKADLGWLSGCLKTEGLSVKMGNSIDAQLDATDIDIATGDILHNKVLVADVDIESHNIKGRMDDNMSVLANGKADICAYVEYDTEDTTHIPTLSCTFAFDDLKARMDTMNAHLKAPKGNATIKGGRRDKTEPRMHVDLQSPAIAFNSGKSMAVETKALNLRADARHKKLSEEEAEMTDEMAKLLLEWSPKVSISLTEGKAELAAIDDPIYIPRMAMAYSNRNFVIDSSAVELGKSRFELVGEAHDIGKWLKHEGMLTGEFSFTAPYADIEQLMGYFNGMGADSTTTEEIVAAEEADEPMPFMVPRMCDLTLNTHITEATFADQHLRNMGGKVYVKDGLLVIEEMGFICEAAKMQLTAMYRTPRLNHLYVGLDYHMTDIKIDELISMIPQVDTLLPMLSSFKGDADFHLAAETYLNAQYDLKVSTLRGACAIEGKDLVLLDGETFSTIAKLLMFNKKTENKIDSISAEIALFKNQIDVYPFMLHMDKYKAALGGQHTLEGYYDYHVSLLSPFYLGVDVKTEEDKKHPGESKMRIGIGKCKYKQDFVPVRSGEIETESTRIKKLIKSALTK